MGEIVNQASAARVKEMSMCKMPRSTNRHDISNVVNGVASNDEPVSAVGHKQIVPQFKAQSNKHKQFRFAGFNMLKSRPMDKNNNQNQNQNSKKGKWIECRQSAVEVVSHKPNATICAMTAASDVGHANAMKSPKLKVKSSSGEFIEEAMVSVIKTKIGSKVKTGFKVENNADTIQLDRANKRKTMLMNGKEGMTRRARWTISAQ